MKVDGTVIIQISGNETDIVTDALVSRAVKDDMLLSCADLIRLRAIPKGFPNAVIEECRAASEDWRKILMAEYSDVLSDELNPKPMKTESPMRISLKKGAILWRVPPIVFGPVDLRISFSFVV